MKVRLSKTLASCLLCFSTFVLSGTAAQQTSTQAPSADSASQASMLRIARDVRKSILTLPEYGVFDYIHFGIKGRTVILKGEASRPTLKSAAENAVKKIEGVESVQNDIDVLPNSPNDDRIRAAVYYRIYSQPSLQKYTSNRGPQFRSLTRRTMGITYDPPIGYHAIHIIVKNGSVTLVGAVDNSSDAALAGMQANLTPGVFSVDNDLFVTSKDGK
ncbi:MAG TPA: BON domain-containing protein [Bryobacteraceae bacterium]|nr:BON domain-containing protein [Bryobacteraceae bacterium]